MTTMKTHIEIEVDVEYDFQPYEPQTRTDPGCDAAIEHMSVEFGGIYINDKLSKDQLEALEMECLECEVKDPTEER